MSGSKRMVSADSPKRLQVYLRRGGVIAYPTESCYGLGALPTNVRGLRKIMRLKRRPQHKGLIVIGDRLEKVRMLLKKLPENEWHDIAEQWPAAKTFVLPCRRNILPVLRGKRRDCLAVRVPDHAVARQLSRLAGMPLVSTSCNRAGRRPCQTEREVRRMFGRDVWVIGGRCGGRRLPSEIIDWKSRTRLR